MKSTLKKASRLLEIERILIANKNGLTQSELARKLGIHRSTLYRYLPDLSPHIYFDKNKLMIDRDADIVNICFNIHEINAMHLASRMIQKSIDKHNKYSSSALSKMAIAIDRISPIYALQMRKTSEQVISKDKRFDQIYQNNLEILTKAWAQSKRVVLWHEHNQSNVYQYNFSLYYIEPYPMGKSLHAIGLSKSMKVNSQEKLRTFKIERIKKIEITDETYHIPDDFNPMELLRDCWGIWYTHNEPVEVVLKFSPAVSQRVAQTQWHSSEKLEYQEDDFLIWSAKISEPKEMRPWIRGWGSDVEIIKPNYLRIEMEEEIIRMMNIYNSKNKGHNTYKI